MEEYCFPYTMNAFEKAVRLAKEIRTRAHEYGYGTGGSQKPTAISVDIHRIKPATPNSVLAELNKPRKRMKNVNLWSMLEVQTEYPQSVLPTLMNQTNERSDVLFFRPKPRANKKRA